MYKQHVKKIFNTKYLILLGVEAGSARREFLAYCLSLLRAHSAEHAEQLPVLDVAALKHVAYVLDALVYYMRAAQPQPQHHQHLWTPVCKKRMSSTLRVIWRKSMPRFVLCQRNG